MYFAKDFKIKAAHKFEFGCGFYFCVIGVLKYIIGLRYFLAETIKTGIFL